MFLYKRPLALILSFAILISCVPVNAFADTDAEEPTQALQIEVQETIPATQPPATQPPETQPPASQPATEPPTEEPSEAAVEETTQTTAAAEETEPPTEETEAAIDTVTEPAEETVIPTEETVEVQQTYAGSFRVSWNGVSHSGKYPDISRSVQVLSQDGSPVETVSITGTGDSYQIDGIPADGNYSLSFGADAAAYRIPSGTLAMQFDPETKTYKAEGSVSAELKTYRLSFDLTVPEGAELPSDYMVSLRLGQKEIADAVVKNREDSFTVTQLYVIDGSYTLSFPEISGIRLTAAARSQAEQINAQTSQPCSFVFEKISSSADFVIYWADDEDVSCRRSVQVLREQLSLSNGAGKEISLGEMTARTESSELPGFQKVVYTVPGLSGDLTDGDTLVLTWREYALAGYENAGSGKLCVPKEKPITLKRSAQAHFTSDNTWCLELPAYDFSIEVTGLNGSAREELLKALEISIMNEEGEFVPYAHAEAFFSGSVLKVRRLYTSNPDGMPGAYYCITFPETIGTFVLEDEVQMYHTVPAQGLFRAGSAVATVGYLDLVTTFSTSGTAASDTQKVIWCDPDDSYNHDGDFSVSVPVTVTVKTRAEDGQWILQPHQMRIELDSENWNGTAYVYNWTAADLAALDLPQFLSQDEKDELLKTMPALTVAFDGDNNMNRELTAKIAQTLSMKKTQFKETQTVMELSFEIGDGADRSVTITDFVYNGPKDLIQEYRQVRLEDGRIIFYPFTQVNYRAEFRNGDVPADDALIQQLQNSVRLYNGADGSEIKSETFNQAGQGNAYYYGFDYNIYDSIRYDAVEQGKKYDVSFLAPLFKPYRDGGSKEQIDYAIKAPEYHSDNGEYTFRVEYDNANAANHGTDTTMTYNHGALYFIRTGEMDFEFTKAWLDTDSSQRPDAEYSLHRYTTNGGSYAQAAQIDIPVAGDGGEIRFVKTAPIPRDGEKTTIVVQGLEWFDGEGYPYVYFIRESLPDGSGYEQVFGEVETDSNGNEQLRDTTPYGTRAADDTSVYDGGTLTNRKTNTKTISVTKQWKAAYYQDALSDLSVVMTLYAKHKNSSEAENCAQKDGFAVREVILSGFSAFDLSRTETVAADIFGAHGHELEYYWEETAVIQNGERYEIQNGKLFLPLNQVNMDQTGLGERCEIDEYFTCEQLEGTNTFVNTLCGTTRYHIRKTWTPDMELRDVTFQLYQIGKEGAIQKYEAGGEYTLPQDYPGYVTDENGRKDSGWILSAFRDLPLYDENGNLYHYIAGENNYFPVYGYDNDVDGDGIREANSVVIHNGIGNIRTIKLRKIWLDDSAVSGRGPVTMNVHTANGQCVYGPDGLLGEGIIVDSADNWMREVDVTLYEKDGQIAKTQANDSWKPYEGGFVVTEAKVGDNPVSTADVTDAGYSTVVNNGTQYVVIYRSGSQRTINPVGTDQPDDLGFYTVENLRIGTFSVEVTKIWKDNDAPHRGNFEATMTLSCTEDPARILEGADGYAYAKTHPAVAADGQAPILGKAAEKEDAQQVAASQRLNTADQTHSSEKVYFHNMPLYDELGKVIHYEVRESVVLCEGVEQNGSYKVVSEVKYENQDARGMVGIQTVTNTFEASKDVHFYLLWLDEYRAANDLRPDMYLTLYRTKYTYNDQGEITGQVIEPAGFRRYLWDGENAKKTGDFWSYTFPNMPICDEHGNPIEYYAELSSNESPENRNYLAPQYAVYSGGDFHYDAFEDAKLSTVTYKRPYYTVTHDMNSEYVGECDGKALLKQENSFVMQLKVNIRVQGRKIWTNVPDGFPANDLPLVNFVLTRRATGYRDRLDQLMGDNSYAAAILNVTSDRTTYDFTLRYIGLNDLNGNLIPKDTPVSCNVKLLNHSEPIICSDTALNVWLALIGKTDPAVREELSQYYGQPLTKYNGQGALYDQSIVESYIAPNTDGYQMNHLTIQMENTSTNANNIENTLVSKLKGSVSFDKRWTVTRKNESGAAVTAAVEDPDSFAYPNMEIGLFRTARVSAEGKESYTAPELVETRNLTGDEVKTLELSQKDGRHKHYAVFENLEIYAPNGERYIYFIGERKVGGYEQTAGLEGDNVPKFMGDVNAIDLDRENYWYSDGFMLIEEKGEAPVVVTVAMTNDYTAYTADITGSKTWVDHNNAFETRPDVLVFDLMRNEQKVAQITLNKAAAGSELASAAITVQQDLVNLSGKVSVRAERSQDQNKWSFTVENLDRYRCDGAEWSYSLKENTKLPNYSASGSGMDITNRLHTAVEVKKQWVGVNPALSNPHIRVELYVSTNGIQWDKAWNVFGQKLDYPEEYYKRIVWDTYRREYFDNLPVGQGEGDNYVAFQYRVVETGVEIGQNEDGSIRFAEVTPDFSGAANGGTIVGTTDSIRAEMTTGENSRKEQLDTILNHTELVSLKVTKKWINDWDNGYGTRETDQTGSWVARFHVYRKAGADGAEECLMSVDGKSKFVLVITGTGDTAEATLENLLQKSPDGKEYIYTVRELNPDGSETDDRYNGAYAVTYQSSAAQEITVSNELLLTDLAVTKIWQGDSEGACAFRPDTIELTLWRNDKNADQYIPVANADTQWSKNGNEWTITYQDLPRYAPDGRPYQYRVTEKAQSGYLQPVYENTAASEQVVEKNVQGYAHTTRITNTATQISLNKVGADGNLNATLVFQGPGNTADYKLTWTRDENGEHYTVFYKGKLYSSDNSTAGSPVVIRGLPLGTYRLTDEVIPDGYYFSAEGKSFTIASPAAGQQTLAGTAGYITADGDMAAVKNEKTALNFQKMGISGGIASGWQFMISGKFADNTTQKRIPDEDLTGKLIVDEIYTLQETVNPEGYILSSGVVTFKLSRSGAVEIISDPEKRASLDEKDPGILKFTDPDFGFTIRKLSGDGTALTGAEFWLYASYDGGNSWQRVKHSANTELVLKAGEASLRSNATNPRLVASAQETVRYKLTEKLAPQGYEIGAEVIFRFDESGNIVPIENAGNPIGNTIEIKNESIEITLVKLDGGDAFAQQKPLPGVRFLIKEFGAQGEGTPVETNASGEITFKPGGIFMLEGGKSYTITEVAKAGYQPLDQSIHFTVRPDGTLSVKEGSVLPENVFINDGNICITAVNERISGTVTVTKISDLGDQYSLKDARFALYRRGTDGSWLDKLHDFLTGNQYDLVWNSDETIQESSVEVKELTDGRIVLTGLPWGEYELREEKAPDGFVLDSDQTQRPKFRFTISPDGTTAEFSLTAEGTIRNEHFTFTFSKHAGRNNVPGAALSGADFTLYWKDGENLVPVKEHLTSGNDGTVTIHSAEILNDQVQAVLEWGKTYRIVETKAPEGYELPDPSENWLDVSFAADGTVNTVNAAGTFRTDSGQYRCLNVPIEITLVKTDGGDAFAQQKPMPGIRFLIKEEGGNGDGVTVTADEQGKIRFSPDGSFMLVGGKTYTMTEISQLAGYEPVSFTFRVEPDGALTMQGNGPDVVTDADGNIVIEAVNIRKLGTVDLEKTDPTGNVRLKGAQFTLYRDGEKEPIYVFSTAMAYSGFVWSKDGKIIGANETAKETDDGCLTIPELPWGAYKLVETKAPDGYLFTPEESERTCSFVIGPQTPEALSYDLKVKNKPNELMVHKVGEDDRTVCLSGAMYELYSAEADGTLTRITNTSNELEPLWSWDTETGTGRASCLPAGNYLLRETRAPFGYVLAQDITFQIDSFGVVTVNGRSAQTENGIPVIKAVDQKTVFSFTKKELYNESCSADAASTRILPGVTFTAYRDAACTQAITTAASDEKGIVTFIGLPLEDYMGEGTRTPVYIRETATAAGHVLDTTVYQVFVRSFLNDQGEVVSSSVLQKDDVLLPDNTVVNDVFRADFLFAKVSEADQSKRISGAVYGLYKGGLLGIPVKIDEAVSDENGMVRFGGLLMDVVYTVQELSVPAGCWLSENSISFRYTWQDGAAVLSILDDGEGTITQEEDLRWLEPQTRLSILKIKSNGQPLAGAKLQLRDADGNIVQVRSADGKLVDYWISTKEPFEITGILEAGQTYWLYELSAPSGYVKASRKSILIPEKAVKPGADETILVKLKNYAETENPKTADEILRYTGAAAGTGLGLLGVMLLEKKRRRKN